MPCTIPAYHAPKPTVRFTGPWLDKLFLVAPLVVGVGCAVLFLTLRASPLYPGSPSKSAAIPFTASRELVCFFI